MEVCQQSLNELTIEQDVPAPEKCCYCISHGLGLYLLALLKLVISVATLIFIMFTLFLLMIFSALNLLYPVMALACIAIFITLVDIFIGIVAIVSICVNDPGMLDMYYRYTVYVFRSLAVLCCIISFLTGAYIFTSTDILSRHVIGMSILLCILFSILVSRIMDASQSTLNDETTEQVQVPVQKSYCNCIPRRIGIIVLALIKLVLGLGLFVLLWNSLLMYYLFGHPIWFYIIITWIVIFLDVFDVVFSLMVIISVCSKIRRIMKIYYIYSICFFGGLTFLCCVIVFTTTANLVALLILILTFFLVFRVFKSLTEKRSSNAGKYRAIPVLMSMSHS